MSCDHHIRKILGKIIKAAASEAERRNFKSVAYRPSAIGGVIRGFGFSQPSCSTRLKMAHSFTHKMYSISSQILRKVLRLKPFKLVYYKDKAYFLILIVLFKTLLSTKEGKQGVKISNIGHIPVIVGALQ